MKSRRDSLKVERNNNRGNIFFTIIIYINKLISNMFDDKIYKVVETNRNRRSNVRRRNNRNNSTRRTIGVLWGERDRGGADWNVALEEALFDPIRLGDVLGRNRNDRDMEDWDDNFSESSIDRYSITYLLYLS